MRAVIGVDIGASKTLCCLFDEEFRLLAERKTRSDEGARAFLGGLAGSLARLSQEARRRGLELAGAGVGCSGRLERRRAGLRWTPVSLPLPDFPLEERVGRLAGAPGRVVVGNDVHLGLYGEHQLGAAHGRRHVIGAFLGTGISGALILDGKLHEGAHGLAGDLGHFMISPLGALAGSERQSVLDDVVGLSGIAGAAAALAVKRWAPALRRLVGADASKIHSGALAKAVERGDEHVEELLRGRARTAGIALACLVDFLNPEMVVLGGGLVEAMPRLFLGEIREAIRRHSVERAKRVAVVKAALGGRAVAAGAARLAWERFGA